ncbi:hypothetical protein FVEG_13273 [Fusarium verticillioides 7600]|uniref:Uncharacterized protein n=1 Tax=Gibberella moniliformis (strain M3125 / FGSC 7600) TaxID=334819 RepID=W7NG45_GIBM7|nr:hypothetical protein FVEG_13273 [Fusarium verticillioides 7600]EWG55242.1 hypothetical protein FVEG_13273 [Fusarium verticillioides 7600]RBQ83602.1 hypothetical protein FVER53263_13273 [Fusarium verticillioides]
MSSLGAKIKDILHSDDKDTTTETSHHPPGSFPTEEMEPSETHQGYSKGYEHNKLHKADDPRGHAHKDSGVGFTESNDPTSYKPSNQPISERRDDPLDRTTDTTTTAGTTTAGTAATGTTAAGGLGDTSKIPATESTTGAAAPSTQDHPYWGDLPSGGVHNTVIGHGSPEDENARHRTVHSGATEPTRTSGTLESGTFLHRNDRDTTSSTTNPTDAQRTTQENPSQTSGSRFNEGLAGAGAAGAGALGAHELNKRRHADDDQTPTKADQTTDKTHDEHKGRSFPLLGKDHKDKETHHKEDKHAKEPKESKLGALFHRKDKTETEAKAEQEADQERHGHSKPALAAAGAAWGANTAGKGHDDKTQRDVTDTRGATQYPASGLDSTRDYSTQPTGTTQQDSSHRGAGLATGAAAGVGAGALASHYAQRSENDRTGPTGAGYDSQSYNPAGTSTRDPTSQTYQQGSHGDHSLAKGTAAGLGAGTLASHSGQHSSSDQPSTLGSSSAYGAQPDQPANYSHKDPVGQTSQHDSHRGAGLAAGTAAGLGAGALASRSGREHETTGQSGLDSNRGLESQGNQSAYSSSIPTSQYEQHDSQRGTGLAAGTAAGLGAGALAARSGRDNESTGQSGLDSSRGLSSQTIQPGYSSTNPTSQHQQDSSHHGAGLATGTAAGLGAGALASRSGRDHHSEQPTGLDSKRGFESQTTQPTFTSTRDPTSQSYQQEGSHRGAGLATGAAAGLGAGALASHDSNKRDEDKYLSNEGSRTAQSGTTGTTGTGAGFGTSSSTFNSSHHEPSRKSEHSQHSTSSHHSTLAENANAGKYNTLASGTPSGVAYDDDLSTSRSSEQPTAQKKDDSHFGTKAAGLGAAAAGAGTAAALSRNKDEKPVEDKIREEPQTERKLDQTESHRSITGTVAPQVGINKPVIHKCQKCGEDNDISKYFTSNSGKI